MPKSRARKGRKSYRPRPLRGPGAVAEATGEAGAARSRPGRPAGRAAEAQTRPGAVTEDAPGPRVTKDVAAFQRRVIGSDAWLRVAEDRLVAIVNDERRKRGLVPLRQDDRLRRSARAHSDDMATRGYFSHNSPDGNTPSERIREAGYPAPAGENIAQGQDHPTQVMMAWMNSPPHRANIMHPAVRAIGVGVRHGPAGPWWTQHFGWV
jgi:uncharacterized protein YkwD